MRLRRHTKTTCNHHHGYRTIHATALTRLPYTPSASESEEESKRCVEEEDECVWLERLDWSDVERFIPCAFSNSAAEEEPSAMAFTEGR